MCVRQKFWCIIILTFLTADRFSSVFSSDSWVDGEVCKCRRLSASVGGEGFMTNSSWVKCKAVKMAFNRLWLSSALINRGEELHMISRSNVEGAYAVNSEKA